MEYWISPVILLLLIRYGVPALMTLFFEKIVEPRAPDCPSSLTQQAEASDDPRDAARKMALKTELSKMRHRLDNGEAQLHPIVYRSGTYSGSTSTSTG